MAKKTLDELLGGVKLFGLYTVTGDGNHDPKKRLARCICQCGAIKDVSVANLKSGRSTRCADCAKANPARATNVTHGLSGTPEYQAWASMRYRCGNPRCWNYSDYGGRGITVCDQWQTSFDAFYSDMGPRPEGCSLDRIDNDQGYGPENCRWATSADQQQNRRVTKTVLWRGSDRSTSDLEFKHGMSRGVLANRLARGWNIDAALSTPPEKKKPVHHVYGEKLTTKEITEKFGINRQAFNRRIRQGMTAEQAIQDCAG